MPEPGGQLRYGIPDHRLARELVEHEIGLVRDLGVSFECGHAISTREELEGLFEQGFDAVFLAPGYDRPYSLGLGEGVSTGLYSWDDFLGQSKDAQARPGAGRCCAGKNVVVVGGGAVAMDCAVTAKRLGADRVYAVSLESMEELPADDDEKDLAFREGIRFKPNCRLTRIASEDGAITGVHGVEIRWLEPGRFVPQNAEDVPGSEFSIPAEIVVEAIGTGFSTELDGHAERHGRREGTSRHGLDDHAHCPTRASSAAATSSRRARPSPPACWMASGPPGPSPRRSLWARLWRRRSRRGRAWRSTSAACIA